MSVDRQAVIDRIEALLVANSTPQFTVFAGEPLGLPPDTSPWACYWYLGEGPAPEGRMTLTNTMFVERFQVMCFWHRRVEIATLEALEKEIWDANRSLKAAFRGDSTLNGESADLDITDSITDYGMFPLEGPNGQFYRTLEFELHVRDLEGEAIGL